MNFREQHHMWKGSYASYDALHKRVVSARGQPQRYEECSKTEGKMSWCNLTGDYENISDYKRMCHGCHQKLDVARRISTKEMTSGRNVGVFRHSNRCILTEQQILEARQLRDQGWTWVKLSKKYGVVPNTVKFAVNGKNWKHLQESKGEPSTSKSN